ncbi:MAG: hypothetical protein IJ801_05175 [Lachnospiraceae bacterium]|nr:hypothetical protein [Lachnospiraceae bacterium]
MKLKYYLRGLGVGMVVTALILGLRGSTVHATMSDAEVIARARQLGMVESGSLMLSELTGQEAENDVNVVQQENTVDDTQIQEEIEQAHQTPEEQMAEETVQEESGQEEPGQEIPTEEEPMQEEPIEGEHNTDETETEESGHGETSVESMENKEVTYSDDPILLTIKPGANSYTVSRDLAAAGLVKDVSAFDKFLMDNGYATSIQSGNYEILPGTSESDIARMITGK